MLSSPNPIVASPDSATLPASQMQGRGGKVQMQYPGRHHWGQEEGCAAERRAGAGPASTSCRRARGRAPARSRSQPAACLLFVLLLPFIRALGAWEFLNGAGVRGMLCRGLRSTASEGGIPSILHFLESGGGVGGLASREQPTNTGRKRISWEGENKGSGAGAGGSSSSGEQSRMGEGWEARERRRGRGCLC